jgi:SAM-dependent methyltransferase
MAEEFRLDAVGLDVSASNLEQARESCAAHPPLPVEFVYGPAEALPFPDESFDAVVCECAVSTFQDQPRVVAELARVLKPGGVVGISDMIVERTLPVDVAGLLAPWTCLGGARSTIGYQSLFLTAELRVTGYADETEALRELVVELKRKLLTAGLARFLGAVPDLAGLDVRELRNLLRRGSALIDEGVIQYARMTFAKGRPRFTPSAAPEACSAATIAFRCDPSTGCC